MVDLVCRRREPSCCILIDRTVVAECVGRELPGGGMRRLPQSVQRSHRRSGQGRRSAGARSAGDGQGAERGLLAIKPSKFERTRAYSKNVTPKYRPKRQSAEILTSGASFDTETQRCVRNVRHIAAFRARPDPVCVRDRLSAWGGRIRTSAFRIRSAGGGHPLRLCLRCGRQPSISRCACSSFPPRARVWRTPIWNAEVRVPPPQPASPSLTRHILRSLKNRAVPRGFADMSWSRCAEFGNGGAIPASCLSGPFLVSRFSRKIVLRPAVCELRVRGTSSPSREALRRRPWPARFFPPGSISSANCSPAARPARERAPP